MNTKELYEEALKQTAQLIPGMTWEEIRDFHVSKNGARPVDLELKLGQCVKVRRLCLAAVFKAIGRRRGKTCRELQEASGLSKTAVNDSVHYVAANRTMSANSDKVAAKLKEINGSTLRVMPKAGVPKNKPKEKVKKPESITQTKPETMIRSTAKVMTSRMTMEIDGETYLRDYRSQRIEKEGTRALVWFRVVPGSDNERLSEERHQRLENEYQKLKFLTCWAEDSFYESEENSEAA